jgi:hypothetical protein
MVSLACLGPAVAAGSDSTSPATLQASAGETRKLAGGAVLKVSPGTRYELGRPIRVQLGSGSEQTLAQSVQLISGRVEIELQQTQTPTTAVLIRTANKVSAVAKGGRSIVIANANLVTVAAMSGEMLVATRDLWRTLPSGIVREYLSGAMNAEHAVMPAPAITLSAPVALSVDGSESQVSASASPVPNATGYEFALWKKSGEKQLLIGRMRSTNGLARLEPMPPGSYTITAHALRPSGLEGAESAPAPLRVVAAELPEGAKLVDGGILLPPHQRVKLLGTEGVEISYGKAPNFVAAPSTIGVIRNEPTLVRLRAAGSKDELSIKLAPRKLHADVQLGPARARWPHDQVTVSVRLTDGLGRPLPDDVALTPSVFVNVTPVAVEWKRERNLLTARVPRGTEAGPWVVRVEVADDTGVVVGRDFLEIATAAPPRR